MDGEVRRIEFLVALFQKKLDQARALLVQSGCSFDLT
jgi:hypothetical protein